MDHIPDQVPNQEWAVLNPAAVRSVAPAAWAVKARALVVPNPVRAGRSPEEPVVAAPAVLVRVCKVAIRAVAAAPEPVIRAVAAANRVLVAARAACSLHEPGYKRFLLEKSTH